MENPPTRVPIEQIRERVIEKLTNAFTQDVIGVDELESRLELVYRARTAEEADRLVADLPAASASNSVAPIAGGARIETAHPAIAESRFVAMFTSSVRRDWSVPNHIEVVAWFADATLDLTAATLPPDIVDVHVRAFAANVRIVVPMGLRVVNRVSAFMSNVESAPSLDLAPMIPGAPVVRITGYARLANVEIVPGGSANSGLLP